jgi:hypothetical protein
MSVADARLTGRAELPMRAHECRCLRRHGRVLRKGPLPPAFETIGGGIQIWMRLPVVQPLAPSEELTALWVQLLVRIHFVLFLPLMVEQDQAGASKCVVSGFSLDQALLLRPSRGERRSLLKSGDDIEGLR